MNTSHSKIFTPHDFNAVIICCALVVRKRISLKISNDYYLNVHSAIKYSKMTELRKTLTLGILRVFDVSDTN